jgi:tetratricopeptide (TPR) repeat protein
MKIPDWRKLALAEGILPEPTQTDNHLVLWLPGKRDSDYQHWERIANVPHAKITVEQGICAIPATAMRARQRTQGFFGKLWQRFQKTTQERTWLLPNGEAAEQCGERESDLIVAWAEDENALLEESRLAARWPGITRCQKLGKNLFLVSGIAAAGTGKEAEPTPPQGQPREVAEQLLAAARQKGDRAGEVAALTDLGIVCTREGEGARALQLLEEALTLARQLGDRARESDVWGNLGMASLAGGQLQRALELFEQELAYARETRNPFAEKNALERLGHAYSSLRDSARALTVYDQALALARQVGDRQHEADLLWHLGIQHAELGQPEQAVAKAQAAVDLLQSLGKPKARWFAHHLHRFRTGGAAVGLAGAMETGAAGAQGGFGGGTVVTTMGAVPSTQGPGQAAGPGLLRMAVSAAKAMAKFLGSGFKVVPDETYQKRLRTCATCEHHTGVRCRLCGCFTNAKAWLPHEDCPIGKWPR